MEGNTERKAYIFDLDGTLLDTIEDLAAAVNYSLGKNGLPERSVSEVRTFVGDGMRNLVKRSAPEGSSEELLEKLFADFRDYYKVHYMDRTAPYEGIPEVLAEIKKRGFAMAVISNKADGPTKLLIDRFFPGIFELVWGEREGVKRKPDPESLLAAMEFLGVQAENCVYVGDSDTDILVAENAGTGQISVSWGFRTEEFLRNAGAGRILSLPDELLEIASECC